MSLTTVVLGAKANSVAMDTVGYALREGREVVVHEKGVWEKAYRGSRRLVADGAPVISSLEDVTGLVHTIGRAVLDVDDVAEARAIYRCDSHRQAFSLPVRL
jgi:predicted Rossmann fold nucleotide-binding protein DprA/Smf involved in DNA uptake